MSTTDDHRFAEADGNPDPGFRPPDSAMHPGQPPTSLVRALTIVLVIWAATLTPAAALVALSAARVQAPLANEFLDLLRLSLQFSGTGSILVAPLFLWAVTERNDHLPRFALAMATFVIYGVANFMALAVYSLRIT